MAVLFQQINWPSKFYPLGTLALIVAMLYYLQSLLLPIVLAVLLTFGLSPVVRGIERKAGTGRSAAVAVVCTGMVAILLGLGWITVKQFSSTIESIPTYESRLRQRLGALNLGDSALGRIEGMVTRLQRDLDRSRESPSATPVLPPEVAVQVVPAREELIGWRSIGAAMTPILGPLASVGFAMVLLVFFLRDREDLRDRVLRMVGVGKLAATTRALDDTAELISSYLLRQALVNIGFGVVVAAGLFVLGVPQAALLGFLAGLLRYVPYVGPWIAATLAVGLSLIFLPDWTGVLGVVVFLSIAELVTNLVVEPRVYGQGIGLSPSVTFIMLAFWTLIWGPMGLLVGTPLTVCLLVMGRHVPAMHLFGVMLGDKPALPPYLSLYQRLLAGRADEAIDLMGGAEEDLVMRVDQLLLPALARARADREANVLSREDAAAFLLNAKALAADLAGTLENGSTAHSDRSVLVVSGREALSAVVVHWMAGLLKANGVRVELLSPESLISEIVDHALLTGARVILVAGFASGSVAHGRLLCHRLRHRIPDVIIVMGKWVPHGGETQREHSSGDDLAIEVVSTTAQARDALLRALSSVSAPGQ